MRTHGRMTTGGHGEVAIRRPRRSLATPDLGLPASRTMVQTSVGHQMCQMLPEQEHGGTWLIEIQEPHPPPPRPDEPPRTLTRRPGERRAAGPSMDPGGREASRLISLEEKTGSPLFPAFLPRPRGGPSGNRVRHPMINQSGKEPGRECVTLVVQWLRICWAKQGAPARSLVREDPTCRRAN
ncbi:uncharacterized protein LOC122695621 isoform X3 [Cervus elaphus]|uniref:uncharacterized protein LOC122695621 isoform X3 n=1 Tax=Cervus elaphus TaxID=9860 RepID=UPI001CC2EAE6|nr:uncharacterized protein LOC122695621 isoform X3 [Cervus elaphus]